MEEVLFSLSLRTVTHARSYARPLRNPGEDRRGRDGDVYRARDTKLGRDVAIKVLPEEFAKDEHRLGRFKREAKALASLNHPNIASIYGLEHTEGIHYLVLELIEGETLAERIARGPIPVDESIEIASEIALALEEAHEKGIVHRDLKPANIKLTPDGHVKVLDFGLAKIFAEDTPEADSSMSPTLTRDATRVGVILGTAAYMSPEQAKGKHVDKRTDIFAFGAVLYEMLVGKRAFPGDDVSEILASVIKLEPAWNALPPVPSPRVEELLHRCLEKDVKKRRRDIGDVRIEIEQPHSEVTLAESRLPWRHTAALLAFGMLVSGVAVWNLHKPAGELDAVRRFSIATPQAQLSANVRPLALSRDGSMLAYTATDPGGRSAISLRFLEQFGATAIDGTSGGLQPFVAPDGNWLGFHASGDLKKVSLYGGTPVTLVQGVPFGGGASWGDGGTIVFGTVTGLARVAASGGDVEQLTTAENAGEGIRHRWPQFLPGAEAVLFTVSRGRVESSIEVVWMESGQRRALVENGTDGRYSASGHLMFMSEARVHAAPFDLQRLEITGPAVPILDDVRVSGAGAALYDLSDDGTLAYYTRAQFPLREIVWVDRSGDADLVFEASRFQSWARLSPEENRILMAIRDEQGASSIWTYDLTRQAMSRLTFQRRDARPVWSPDGAWVAYRSNRDGRTAIYRKRADGSGEGEFLASIEGAPVPQSFLPDGSVLAFTSLYGGNDLGFVDIGGDSEPDIAREPDSEQLSPAFSPTGSRIAYVSGESGRYEVFVRDYPGPGGKWQISSEGGQEPVWSKDGRELFCPPMAGS